ncbi:MAG: hypothetical protein LIO75_03335 [Lachnospiraceae bacterium]|nr:hypothetical protein [Lachnospiraceae bacterium]
MLEADEILALAKSTITDTAVYVAKYNDVSAAVIYSQGSTETIRNWQFVVNSYVLYPDEGESLNNRQANIVVKTENGLIRIYQALAVPLAVISLISMAILTVAQIPNIRRKDRKLFDRWLVALAAFLMSYTVMFVYTVFSAWSTDLPIPFYCSAAYILMQIAQITAIYFAVSLLIKELPVLWKHKT